MVNLATRPRNITVERASGVLQIEWADGVFSTYPLVWLRKHCPCASCREERHDAVLNTDPLKLMSGPLPSAEVAGAELMGNYALRMQWRDGHDSGIYAFSALRAAWDAAGDPAKLPPLLPD